jgi:hypothetical protein
MGHFVMGPDPLSFLREVRGHSDVRGDEQRLRVEHCPTGIIYEDTVANYYSLYTLYVVHRVL